MAGFIAYDNKPSGSYAKLCISKRVGDKVRKTYVCLGKVLDKDRNIFRNRERGVFTFNPETGEYGKPEESFVPNEEPRKNRRELLVLDFGDAFFLDSFIKSIRFDNCIEALGYGNPDTTKAMLLFIFYLAAAMCMRPHGMRGAMPASCTPKLT